MRTVLLLFIVLLVACGTAGARRTLHQYTVYTLQPGQQSVQANTLSSGNGYANAVAYVQADSRVQDTTVQHYAPSQYQTTNSDDQQSINTSDSDQSWSKQQGNNNHGSQNQIDNLGHSEDSNGRSDSVRGNSGDSITDSVLQNVLDMHNAFRSRHKVGALSWSSQLQNSAQSWANRCVFQHSGPGENLAMNFLSFESAVDAWFDEEKDYRWDGQFSYSTGHFTQAIWKDTAELGCGYAPSCSLYVCHYNPAGNVIGNFNDNVFPAAS